MPREVAVAVGLFLTFCIVWWMWIFLRPPDPCTGLHGKTLMACAEWRAGEEGK